VRASQLFVGLLVVHAGLLAFAAARHSPTIDELGHLAAGVSHWQTGRFELYRVNPPLVRAVATLPLVLMNPKVNWDLLDLGRDRPEFSAGLMFVRTTGPESSWAFVIARWACVPFSLLGAWVCYQWARELYGPWAGLLAGGLWCLDPNVLGNAQMITPDTGATAFGALACFVFWKWLGKPSWRRTLGLGVVWGLAELCKTSWLLLYPLLPLVWVVYRCTVPGVVGWRAEAVRLAVAAVLSVVLLNAGYGFGGTFTRLGEYPFRSTALTGYETPVNSTEPGNRFAGTWAGWAPVPLPMQYVLGVDNQKMDFERKFPSYLRGEWRRKGWWYYYAYAFLIKTPVGTLGLLTVATALAFFVRPPGVRRADEFVLLLPGVAMFAFVSSQTGFNHHLRYVLPAFPFFFVWTARLAALCDASRPRLQALVVALFALGAVESLARYPHSLSFFNVTIGGPENGYRHLVDSNIEWGQDVAGLKRWADQHPEARPLYSLYWGLLEPEDVGLKVDGYPPSGPILHPEYYAIPEGYQLGPLPGWYVVGVTFLTADDMPERGTLRDIGVPYLGYFQHFTPVDRIGYSLNVYHVTLEDANRVRAILGLPALPADWQSPGNIRLLQRRGARQ